ncbi:MAG: hypothetical protein ACREOI_22850 [bacterium]
MQPIPVSTIRKLLAAWVALGLISNLMIEAGFKLDVARYFPISEFYGPTIHVSGLPYAALFLIVFFLAIKHVSRFNLVQVWLLGLTLILLGNLAQGSIDAAFYKPFYGHGGQYYHDAIRITDWRQWLRDFNVNQTQLQNHSQTHPPFAVLVQYLLLEIGNRHLFILAGGFILLSSLSIILVWQILRESDLPAPRSSELALLFAVIPAFNIYSAVSLEGVVAMLCTLFLLGVIKLVRQGISRFGMFLFATGLLLANLLTFIGTFLLATAGLIGLREILVKRKAGVVIALTVTLLLGMLAYVIMLRGFGYDHLEAFLAAARYDNPEGFRALHAPLDYVMTRIEGMAEIALFLSFGALAILFHHDYLKLRITDFNDEITSIFLAGAISLLIMFLVGAFKTGETARICLFIYPYIMLVLRKLGDSTLRAVTIFAGLQTIIMQTFGGYFW